MLEIDPKVQARIDAVRAANPGKRVTAIDTAAGVLVLVNPSRQQYIMFQTMQWSDDVARKATAYAELLRMCCKDPGADAMTGILEEWPGLPNDGDVIEALKELTGSSKKK